MKSDKEKTRKTSLKSITPGEHLRLRDNVHEYMQTREWIFGRVERDETILLVHEREGFGWNVKMGDIDWEAYRKSKEKKGL
jgi:hypothetical protein